ncbi:hypothetical protein PP1_011915 [Pseudonocardia sp. P1]
MIDMGTTEMTAGVASIDTAVACEPLTVVPHAVAHAALADLVGSGVRRRPQGVRLTAATSFRAGGDVSPESGGTAVPMISGPIAWFHKSTGASVPGRRGGT